MPVTRQQAVITVSAALDLIQAAIAEGDRIGVPVSACVVDTSMSLVAFARSDGATPHSADTSRAKANTAASIRRPTGGMGEDLALPLAVATGGRLTNILGGSPIWFARHARRRPGNRGRHPRPGRCGRRRRARPRRRPSDPQAQ